MVIERKIVFFVLVVSLVLVTLAVRTQASADPPRKMEVGSSSTGGRPRVGFTITHTRVAGDPERLCARRGGTGAVSGSDAVIAHYDDSTLRTAVMHDLAALRLAGASVARTVFWFRPAADLDLARMAEQNDPLAMMVAREGKLPGRDVRNISAFAEDVQRAGYKQLVIAFGNEGRWNPTCRGNGVWGACYDSQLDPQTWSTMEQIIRAVKSTPLPHLDVFYEIAGETCFYRDPASLLQRNLEHYTRYMVEHYRQSFGDDKYIVSCVGGNAQRVLRELTDTGAFFREARPKPAFVDIHIYFDDPKEIATVLTEADSLARQLAIPLEIGETFADHEKLFQIIKKLRDEGRLRSLRNIMVWPRKVGSQCETDVAPRDVLHWIAPFLAGAF